MGCCRESFHDKQREAIDAYYMARCAEEGRQLIRTEIVYEWLARHSAEFKAAWKERIKTWNTDD